MLQSRVSSTIILHNCFTTQFPHHYGFLTLWLTGGNFLAVSLSLFLVIIWVETKRIFFYIMGLSLWKCTLNWRRNHWILLKDSKDLTVYYKLAPVVGLSSNILSHCVASEGSAEKTGWWCSAGPPGSHAELTGLRTCQEPREAACIFLELLFCVLIPLPTLSKSLGNTDLWSLLLPLQVLSFFSWAPFPCSQILTMPCRSERSWMWR